MNVFEKLQKARIILQSKDLKKSGHNKFAGYSYFELGDFLPTINQIFQDVGLCGVVSFNKDIATLCIVNLEKTDDLIVFTSPMAEAQLKGCHPIQNLGAVETYSRRYLWVTAMEIVEHDALDASSPLDAPKPAIAHKSVPTETFDSLDAEAQAYIKELASEVMAKKTPEEQVEYLGGITLDVEEKTALWSLLDSKTRSAMKKVQSKKGE